jgi:hypothetical protein
MTNQIRRAVIDMAVSAPNASAIMRACSRPQIRDAASDGNEKLRRSAPLPFGWTRR